MTTRTVRAGATSFLLRTAGSDSPGSTPVLLLHGVPETATCWAPVLPALAEGRRVLAPDLPGLGGSRFAGPYDVPTLVQQLAALLDAEVPAGRVDVVGHDWGGVLALALAAAQPGRVRRLVVANAPYREVPWFRAGHIPFFCLPVAPELLFRLGGRRVTHAMLDHAWRSRAPLDPASRAEYVAAYSRPDALRAMLGYYRELARPRIAALLRREPAPPPERLDVERALVLWGALDPVLPIGTGESVVRDLGAGAEMVTVPGAGHFVIEEAPDVVTRVLLEALEQDDPGLIEPPAGAPAR